MRLIKMIGLAAIAALAAMAFVGASSASATSTALCTVDEPTCAEANRVKHIHEVDPLAILKTSILTVHCVGLFLGDTLSPWLGSPLHITGTFTYSGCKEGEGGSCEAKELGGPALITVLKTATELALVTGEGEVLVKCGSFLHCVVIDVRSEGPDQNLAQHLSAGRPRNAEQE